MTDLTIKETLCRDNQLLAVSMRPREFTHDTSVCPSPAANAIYTYCNQQTPNIPQALISRDLNHVCKSSTRPTFTQYVTCHARDNKKLDSLYASTMEAYSS